MDHANKHNIEESRKSSCLEIDLFAFENYLKSVNEANKLFHQETESVLKSCQDKKVGILLSDILNELQIITDRAKNIENVVQKLSTYTEESHLKGNAKDCQIKTKLKLVPLEKLIAKSIKNENENENDKSKKVLMNEEQTNLKSVKTCCVRIKRTQLLSLPKNHDKGECDEDCLSSDDVNGTKKLKKRIFITSSSSLDSMEYEFEQTLKHKQKTKKRFKFCSKEASLQEEQRRKRVEERQSVYNQIYCRPENVEIKQLALDFDDATKKTILEVDKGLVTQLKPHQSSGIKFMWDACFETVKSCKEKAGSGCILAHCMGLGKTFQVVALVHTLISNSKLTGVERVLIISPLSTLSNWAREFCHWTEFAQMKELDICDLSKYKDKSTRAFKLNEWLEGGGVCIIGYDMYRILSSENPKGFSKKLKVILHKSLVNPGPDLVICDEGHLLKNEKTSLSQAVSKVRTKRRIILTGTPLQNNLKEYYCMIQFIKPNLLGTYKEYLNRFVNPITNGQYINSTEQDIRLMRHRSHVLHKMLESCIQRRDYSVLQPYLPFKHEYVVFISMSDIQKELYSFYMTKQKDSVGESDNKGGSGAKLFDDFTVLRRIWTHPINLCQNLIKRIKRYDSEDSLENFINDTEESSSSDSKSDTSENAEKVKFNCRSSSESKTRDIIENQDEWWTKFIKKEDLKNLYPSSKLLILMEILHRCEFIGDKVLVFSQSLQSLDAIEYFLSLIDKKTRGLQSEGNVENFKGFWQLDRDYLRLDGSCSVENREKMCKKFNDATNSQLRLFLISTRAGGLGINLVSANRVVILDVSWNPSHDTQSIFRVYRFGQNKPCYIYRLISLGTMEQKIYERQIIKQATAKRVIDEQQINRHYNQSDLQELYTFDLTPTTQRETPILPKDRLFAELLSDYKQLIFKYHEHDSLLESDESENLTEEERKAAWNEYEAEKNKPQYSFYNRPNEQPSGSLTSNKTFGFRNDLLLRLLNIKISQDQPGLSSTQKSLLVPVYLQKLSNEMHMGNLSMYKELLMLNNSLELSAGVYPNPLLHSNQQLSLDTTALSHQEGISRFDPNKVYEVD